jgi:hypothetical protein
MRLITTTLAAAALVVGSAALAAPAGATTARHFANCDAMHRVYPHGVGKPGAHDHTSGTPVTSFTRSVPLYNANAGSDRDKDGIACEAT